MKKRLIIYSVILTFILIYKYYSYKINENFDVSAENSFTVKENKLDIHKLMEENKIKYISEIKKNWDENIVVKNVDKIPSNGFKLKKIIEEAVRDELNSRINNTKISVGEIERIGWYNEELDKQIIFNFDILIINREELWVLPVNVWLSFDINTMCENMGDGCINIISQDLEYNLIGNEDIKPKLKILKIKEDETQKYNVKPTGYIVDYFRIKNNLYLTEPFLTSREEMRL